jgi:hypothetical protein
MQPTVKAILARFEGQQNYRLKAIDYCIGIADTYPHLRQEYMGLLDMVRTERKSK